LAALAGDDMENERYKGMQIIEDPMYAVTIAYLVPLGEHHSLLFIGNRTARYRQTARVTVSQMLIVWKI
jgi:hypothetical protein